MLKFFAINISLYYCLYEIGCFNSISFRMISFGPLSLIKYFLLGWVICNLELNCVYLRGNVIRLISIRIQWLKPEKYYKFVCFYQRLDIPTCMWLVIIGFSRFCHLTVEAIINVFAESRVIWHGIIEPISIISRKMVQKKTWIRNL